MGLSPYDFEQYKDEIFDDDLANEALNLLQKRYTNMAHWIQKNKPLRECPECGYEKLEYVHNGISCKRCDFFKDIEVPYPANGGVATNRTLKGIIKEIFGRKMGQLKKKSKPTQEKLSELPFSIESFDTGEYTKSQIDYLQNRFETLMEENRVNNEVDKFYIRAMAVRELEIMRLERQRAVSPDDVDTNELKKQYSIYNDLSSKVKADRASRDDENQQAFYDEMEEVLADSDIEDIIKQYEEEKENKKQYLEKSKERREEVGNRF